VIESPSPDGQAAVAERASLGYDMNDLSAGVPLLPRFDEVFDAAGSTDQDMGPGQQAFADSIRAPFAMVPPQACHGNYPHGEGLTTGRQRSFGAVPPPPLSWMMQSADESTEVSNPRATEDSSVASDAEDDVPLSELTRRLIIGSTVALSGAWNAALS